MNRSLMSVIVALLFTIATLIFGFLSFGIWTSLIFSSGFLGGFVIWIFLAPNRINFKQIKTPFIMTFSSFIFIHKVEENVTQFQETLSELTGVPVPDISSIPLILLLIVSVGAWLFIPYFVNRKIDFGYYLAWTFFAAMGITELTHFIFPFFIEGTYSYFPGMISVFVLAPFAWWGMYRLIKRKTIFDRRFN